MSHPQIFTLSRLWTRVMRRKNWSGWGGSKTFGWPQRGERGGGSNKLVKNPIFSLKNCSFPKCIFQRNKKSNCIFPNCIFPNCIFPNCIFPNCIFPNCILSNCIFSKHFLSLYFSRLLFSKLYFSKLYFPKLYISKLHSFKLYFFQTVWFQTVFFSAYTFSKLCEFIFDNAQKQTLFSANAFPRLQYTKHNKNI